MKRFLAIVTLLAGALAACDTAITETAPMDGGALSLRAAPGTVTDIQAGPPTVIAGKVGKTLVCHVGSETGPAGEVYDPACVPGDVNGWFCPDAGKVDLLEVSASSRHLGNPSHAYGGVSDYEPGAMGASGVGTDDSDGDGIDDGCEIPAAAECPCWDEGELTAVTAANLSPDACSGYVGTGGSARAIFSEGEFFQVGFIADPFGEGTGPWCGVLYPVATNQPVSAAEAETCVAQIEARCAEIEGGGPIVIGGRATARTRR
jgi:hypothetical protein